MFNFGILCSILMDGWFISHCRNFSCYYADLIFENINFSALKIHHDGKDWSLGRASPGYNYVFLSRTVRCHRQGSMLLILVFSYFPDCHCLWVAKLRSRFYSLFSVGTKTWNGHKIFIFGSYFFAWVIWFYQPCFCLSTVLVGIIF